MSLVSVLFLSTLATLVAGDCNVYDSPQPSTIDSCHQIQECIENTFYGNKNNMYILEKVFMSTQSRSPTALIVKYKVTRPTTDRTDNTSGEHNSEHSYTSGSGNGSNVDGIYFDPGNANYSRGSTWDSEWNTTSDGEVSYIQIGWSTTGVYKFLRPVVLVTLQPVLLWRILSIAIDDYGFPKLIKFEINITNSTKCQWLKDITPSDLKEALEHLTMKVG